VLGSYASQVIVPAAKAIYVPDQFTTTQALMFQSMTAQYLVTEYREVRPGDRVLVRSPEARFQSARLLRRNRA
jgi:NADPH2:quinone reductase